MREYVTSLIERHEKTAPGDDEYIGEDGLFYCRKCHTKTQHRLKFQGKEHVVTCVCRCQKEAQAAYEEHLAQIERKNHIARLKANGIQDKALLQWTFDAAEDCDAIRIAKKYVENWKEARKHNLGLVLWGDVGRGKSFVAACIANALLDQGVTVLLTNFSKILNQMGGMYSEERYQYIASFAAYDLLIIDDFGIERNTEYAMEMVYAVIDERYKSGKPLIITTNLHFQELKNADDISHSRIYSRLGEMCTAVCVEGIDRRTNTGNDKRRLIKVLFGEEQEV